LLTAIAVLSAWPSDARPAHAQAPGPLAEQQPCALIYPPPPGCAQVPGRISVNAGGPYSGRVGQPVFFRATVASPLPPGTLFEFRWSFGDGTSGSGQTVSHVYASGGTYPVTVTVFGAGQTAVASTSASITASVQPLQVSVGGPYNGQAGTAIFFTSSVTGAAPGTSIRYQWSFGDGTFGSGASPSHAYTAPGTFTVTLQVQTSAGQSGFASTFAQISRPAQSLVVNPGGPYSGVVGSSVSFFGSVSGAANPRYQWSFGDGALASGQNVAHIYSAPGTYSVSLTVTDLSTGTNAQATTITTISAAPTPVPPQPNEPAARAFASLAHFPPSGAVVLFGGLACGSTRCTDQDDTWTWNGSTWTEQSPVNAPSSRFGATLAYHPPSQRLILFGGLDCSEDFCGDSDETWAWSGSDWTLLNPATRPPERSDASLVWDSARNVLVLFGGQDTGGDILNDTWTFDGSTWTQQTPATSPSARYGAAMAFDSSRNVTVLFGGSDNGTANFGDTWIWDGSTWTRQTPAASPPPRALAGVAFDAAANLVLVFGGVTNGNQALGDTWTWNGSTWAQQNPSASPAPRYGPATAYSSGTNSVVLFSGTNAVSDTWLWNGSAWTQP